MYRLVRWFFGPLARWRARRRAVRDLDARLAAWAPLAPEERARVRPSDVAAEAARLDRRRVPRHEETAP